VSACRCTAGLQAFLFCTLSIFARAGSLEPTAPPNFPLPQFKSATFSVRDFGATGNGRDNDTAAINRAIEKCSTSGGGDVIFPRGTYVAASIHLQSNVRLVLDKDAVVTGAKSGYDSPEPNKFEKYQDFGHSHFHNALMWGDNIENFAIVGGRINGGHIIEGDDAQGRDIGDKVIAIKSSRNLLFDRVTHESGGHFVYLLNDCENVTLANVVIKKSRDAVNLVSCRKVEVRDCNFTGCGDDTLALKSDYALGRKIDSADIYVWNSYFESAANALEFGAESVGNFRNVNFWNIRIGRAWKAGIGIRSTDGAIVDGVTYRNISMKNVDTPISVTLGNRLLSGEPGQRVGAIRNITISNVTATEPRPRVREVVRPALIAGLPESPLENILLEHLRIVGKGGGAKRAAHSLAGENKLARREAALGAAGFYIAHASGVRLQDVDLSYEGAETRPSLVAHDVSELELDELRMQKLISIPLMQLNKIDGLTVHQSPGLSERNRERVDAAEE
jgi:Pectate lyase superfamily protein